MWLIYALAWWLVAIAVHAVACRLSSPGGMVTRFLVVGSISGSCLVWWAGARHGILAPETLSALLAYALLCELYIFLATLVRSSISATLLLMLRQGNSSHETVLKTYDSVSMVSRRIERLLSAGLLVESNRGLRLTPTGRRLASIFLALRKFLGHSTDAGTPADRHRG